MLEWSSTVPRRTRNRPEEKKGDFDDQVAILTSMRSEFYQGNTECLYQPHERSHSRVIITAQCSLHISEQSISWSCCLIDLLLFLLSSPSLLSAEREEYQGHSVYRILQSR